MSKKRPKPSEIAVIRHKSSSWFARLSEEDQDWVIELIKEIVKVEKPSYYIIANRMIDILHLNVFDENIVRFLKRKVKQCHEKNQAK